MDYRGGNPQYHQAGAPGGRRGPSDFEQRKPHRHGRRAGRSRSRDRSRDRHLGDAHDRGDRCGGDGYGRRDSRPYDDRRPRSPPADGQPRYYNAQGIPSAVHDRHGGSFGEAYGQRGGYGAQEDYHQRGPAAGHEVGWGSSYAAPPTHGHATQHQHFNPSWQAAPPPQSLHDNHYRGSDFGRPASPPRHSTWHEPALPSPDYVAPQPTFERENAYRRDWDSPRQPQVPLRDEYQRDWNAPYRPQSPPYQAFPSPDSPPTRSKSPPRNMDNIYPGFAPAPISPSAPLPVQPHVPVAQPMSAAPPPSVAVAKPQGPSPAEQCARIIRIVREHDPAASLALPNAIAPQISVGALHHMTETYADLTTAVREALVLGLVVASAKWRSRLESGDVDQAAAKAFQEAAVAFLTVAASNPPLPALFPELGPRQPEGQAVAALLADLVLPLAKITDTSSTDQFTWNLRGGNWLPETVKDVLLPLLSTLDGSSKDAGISSAVDWTLPSHHPSKMDNRARWTSYGVTDRELDAAFGASESKTEARVEASNLFVKKRSILPTPLVMPGATAGGDKPPRRNSAAAQDHGHVHAETPKNRERDGKQTGLRGGMDVQPVAPSLMPPQVDVEMKDAEPESGQTNGLPNGQAEAPMLPASLEPADDSGDASTDAGGPGTDADGGTEPEVETPIKTMKPKAALGPSSNRVVEISLDELLNVPVIESNQMKEREKAVKKLSKPEETVVKAEGLSAQPTQAPSGVKPVGPGSAPNGDARPKRAPKRKSSLHEDLPGGDKPAQRRGTDDERRQKAEAKKKLADETEAQRLEREEARRAAKREADRKRREEKRQKELQMRAEKERELAVAACIRGMVDAVSYSVELDEKRAKGGNPRTVLDEELEREFQQRRREAEAEERARKRAAKAAAAGTPAPTSASKRKPDDTGGGGKRVKQEGYPSVLPGYGPMGPYGYPYPMYGPPMIPGAPGMAPPPGMPGMTPPGFPSGAPGVGPNAAGLMPTTPMMPGYRPMMPMQHPSPNPNAAMPGSPAAGGDPLETLPFLKDPSVQLSEDDKTLMRDFLRGRFSGQHEVRTVTLASFLVPEPGCDPPRARWIKETVEFEMTFANGMWRRSRKKRRGITHEQALAMGLEMREEDGTTVIRPALSPAEILNQEQGVGGALKTENDVGARGGSEAAADGGAGHPQVKAEMNP